MLGQVGANYHARRMPPPLGRLAKLAHAITALTPLTCAGSLDGFSRGYASHY